MSDVRYPIGPFQAISASTPQEREGYIIHLREMPDLLRLAVEDFSSSQVDTPYRPGGWTVRQVVHHLADSHLNWYARTKLALTENEPVIKPFDENLWADLTDARFGPVQSSLAMLDGLHLRWTQLFESLTQAEWSSRLMHPERGLIALDFVLPMISWHGRHHTAHITELRKKMNW